MIGTLQITGIVIGIIVLYLLSCIRILLEYQRGVIFRLGRALPGPKGPGLLVVFWPIDWMMRVSLRVSMSAIATVLACRRNSVKPRSARQLLVSMDESRITRPEA